MGGHFTLGAAIFICQESAGALQISKTNLLNKFCTFSTVFPKFTKMFRNHPST